MGTFYKHPRRVSKELCPMYNIHTHTHTIMHSITHYSKVCMQLFEPSG